VVRDYLYIDDLVDGICRAAFTDSPERVFNVGSGEGVSLNELVAVIRAVTGKEVPVNYSLSRSFDVPAIYLDITRAQTQLGWKPVTPLREGIRRTWEFISSLS
jgi:UDP-glucose 4-epimerase